MRIPSGSTNRLIFFVAVDSTDLKTRETGLTTFTVYRSRNGGTATVMATPTVTELSASNMPGVYALTLDEDTTLTAGRDTEEMCFHITQASMAPVTRVVEIYRPETTEGNTLDVTAGGNAGIDLANTSGTWTGGQIGVGAFAASSITATAIATDAITSAKIAAGAITSSEAPNLDAAISSRSSHSAADVWTSGTRTLTALGFTFVAGDFGAASLNGKGDWNTATPLDAAGIRTAVGLAAANLDTQLGDIPTVSEFNARTLVAASYFDPTTDTVANVTTVATTTNLTNLPSIPANWLTAAGTAADFGTEVAAAVWDRDATLSQTQGTFGQAIGDPALDATTIYQSVATDAAGDNIAIDLADVPTVAEFNARTLVAAAYFDPATDTVANVTTVATTTTNTDMRGTDSAALASVCTEARLAELDAANLPAVTDGIQADLDNGTDGLGALLTAINANATPAEVLTQVNAALDTAISELSQAVPTATPTVRTGIMLLYMALRNRLDVNTSGTPDVLNIYNDAGTVIAKKQVTDSGGDYSEAEMQSGP
jgi:hypothetical protein